MGPGAGLRPPAACSLQRMQSTASCSARCHPAAPLAARGTLRAQQTSRSGAHWRRSAAERDLDWEVPQVPPTGPRKTPPPPPPPPPPRNVPWYEVPFTSRRNIGITLVAGIAGMWLANKNAGPQFSTKPPVPFNLVGFTDVATNDFVYFKTPGGRWVAAAEDELGRMFMIDEVGDLYYDSGDPEIGMYAMDTQGNLFNFYLDTDGQRKITPVGNVADLQRFKISEVAGVKLDRDVNVVAFTDGRQIPLPPGTGYVDANGKFTPPGELVEGYTRSRDESLLERILSRGGASDAPPERIELDLQDPADFKRQIFDQTLLDDPDLPGFQAALPEDFSLEELARQVEREQGRRRR